MPQLDYSTIYKEELPSTYPLPPSLAVGYRELDRLVREKLVETLGADVDEFDEPAYRRALRSVIKDATSSTPRDELRAGVIDVRGAGQLLGEDASALNGVIQTEQEAREPQPGGVRLSGLDLAAKAAELLAARGLTAKSATQEAYAGALEEAAVLTGYSENGDQPAPPGRKLSPWARRRVLETRPARSRRPNARRRLTTRRRDSGAGMSWPLGNWRRISDGTRSDQAKTDRNHGRAASGEARRAGGGGAVARA
jgi:hypothetical protein